VFVLFHSPSNTSLELEVSVPEDSAVIEFNYFQGNSISFDGEQTKKFQETLSTILSLKERIVERVS
jgi:hypothetical protein